MTILKLNITLADGLSKDDYSEQDVADSIRREHPNAVFADVTLSASPDGNIIAAYEGRDVGFERIRRITGYL